MQIQKMKLTDLKPAPYNPRVDLKSGDPAYEKLKKGIREFGLVDPIIFNKQTGFVVGGHQRLKVLKDLKYTEVDCVIVDLPPEKEKALNIALNKIEGGWNDEKLAALLNEIDFTQIESDLTGFDMSEIEALTNASITGEVEEDDFDAEAAAEAIKEPKTRLGDIYKLGRHRLICGDSTDAETVAKLMNGQKAELLFTSPPYSDMREYNGNKNLNVNNLINFISVYFKYTEYQVINLGLQRKNHEIFDYWTPYIEKARQSGYKFLAWNIWNKAMAGSIGNQSAFFPIFHEWIFVFGKQFKDINRTVERRSEIKENKTRTIRQFDGSTKKTIVKKQEKLTELSSVLECTPEMGSIRKEHPATFPIKFPSEFT